VFEVLLLHVPCKRTHPLSQPSTRCKDCSDNVLGDVIDISVFFSKKLGAVLWSGAGLVIDKWLPTKYPGQMESIGLRADSRMRILMKAELQ
jgi:hypothetical protein